MDLPKNVSYKDMVDFKEEKYKDMSLEELRVVVASLPDYSITEATREKDKYRKLIDTARNTQELERYTAILHYYIFMFQSANCKALCLDTSFELHDHHMGVSAIVFSRIVEFLKSKGIEETKI